MTDWNTTGITETSEVSLVRWPDDREHRDRLREAGRPRLLLIDATTPAPHTPDVDEDWIRLPASEEDLHARSVALAEKAGRSGSRPVVNGDGRLMHRGEWVSLSPIEEQILGALVRSFGQLVAMPFLTSGLEGHVLTPNAVRVHMMRLRKRIAPLGLVVKTVHGRGYLIELAGA